MSAEYPFAGKSDKGASVGYLSAVTRRPDFRLAVLNLLHDKVRFAVTVMGIAFSVFLMAFQSCLLAGFQRASAAIISAADGQIWITARGVRSFDMGSLLPEHFRDLVYSADGVLSVGRMVASFVDFQRPDGHSTDVMLVGSDQEVGGSVPVPNRNFSSHPLAVDYTSRELLGVSRLPVEVELERRNAAVVEYVRGFGTFLCCPYSFSDYDTAMQIMGYPLNRTMYLIVRLKRGADTIAVRDRLRTLLPEVDVWTKSEFVHRSETFWLTQTGAGAALLLAAALGFIVGAVIISQTIYATTMENIEEYATLKAIGAGKLMVCSIVLTQALATGVAGCAVGLACVWPSAQLALGVIPWMYVPGWTYLLCAGLTLMMCVLAPVTSVRKALFVDPARVFRA